ARPRRAGDALGPFRAREPAPRRLRAPRPLRCPRGRAARARLLPLARGAGRPAGRDAQRGRATDARARPRAHAPPAAPPARRALARARAEGRRRDLPHRRRAERARGPDRPRGRAEREPGARRLVPRVRARSRSRRPLGLEPGAAARRIGETLLPRLLMLLAFDWSQLAQQTVIGLSSGALWALLALALVLIYRSTGVVNFAQGEMAMFSTFIAWSLIHHGLSYWEAFFLTLAI